MGNKFCAGISRSSTQENDLKRNTLDEADLAYEPENLLFTAHLSDSSVGRQVVRQVRRDVTPDLLEKVLRSHGIDTTLFDVGSAKSIHQLADELSRGDCSLREEVHDGRTELIRLVRPVFIKLLYANCVLVNTKDVYPQKGGEDGKPFAKKKQSLIAEKMQSTDIGVLDVAFRGIEEELGIEQLKAQHLMNDDWKRKKEEVSEFTKSSPSYPGLKSVYRQHLVTLELKEDCSDELSQYGLPDCVEFTSSESTSSGPVIHHWKWVSEEEAVRTKIVGLG